MMYDLIIVGGGPAGLTAALYARRASKTVLVIEKETFGGQITFSPKVENIPGFAELSGNEFAEKLVDQVLLQGADMESSLVLSVRAEEDGTKTVTTEDGVFTSKAVIIATGAKHRLLGLPGEQVLVGNGISFCAVCDGAFYAGRDVAVIGGGNSALQEAILLADLAKSVTVVQNLDFLTGEQQLQDLLRSRSNVTIMTGCLLDEYLADEAGLVGIRVLRTADGQKTDLHVDGVFLAVGLIPQNEPFADLIALDARGYADTDESCVTKTAGVFVAGDCRAKRIRQVTTAAADGAIAALAACDYIDQQNG